MSKSADAFRTIGEVSLELGVPKHVLRFWEQRFKQLKPMKLGGGRRFYRPEDVELLAGIKRLLYEHSIAVKGVQRILRDQGIEHVKAVGAGAASHGPVVAIAQDTHSVAPDNDPAGRVPEGKPRRKTLTEPPAPAEVGVADTWPDPGSETTQILARAISELRACRAVLGKPCIDGSAPVARRAGTAR